MKRHMIRISLFMLLGVVTSVAVAWGCAWRVGDFGDTALHKMDFSAAPWSCPPEGWPVERFRYMSFETKIAGRYEQAGSPSPDSYKEYEQTIMTFGWPWRCCARETRCIRDFRPPPAIRPLDWTNVLLDESIATLRVKQLQSKRNPDGVALPLRPILPGLLANTAIYGGVWWAMLFGPGMFIRWRRRCAGRCAKCGYDLRGTESDACPECGAAR